MGLFAVIVILIGGFGFLVCVLQVIWAREQVKKNLWEKGFSPIHVCFAALSGAASSLLRVVYCRSRGNAEKIYTFFTRVFTVAAWTLFWTAIFYSGYQAFTK